ncbi:MAG: TIGR00730 family Rossman fold protein [Deltaproteobacteria bacterium]|nr:TIGR00730 family Rossman fold protein [Deltaproteobacteria bacterium]
MEISFEHTGNDFDLLIEQLNAKAQVNHPDIIREMIVTVLKAGCENDYLADLKLMRTTMKELRYTNKIFGPYRKRKKVTIFGSARTTPEEPIYRKCRDFARSLVDHGYMVITGGGGGIMQAGNEGAGADNSFAVNIRLPFEQETNPVMRESQHSLTYKYFFSRKLAFLKEAHAVALFPGGFGTLDEAMETLTLVQTGKNPPIPLIFIEDDDNGYWESVLLFMKNTLLTKGLISGQDFSLFSITRDIDEAVRIIDDFYSVYHSIRFSGKTLIVRLNKPLTAAQVQTLEEEFRDIIIPGGHLRMDKALPIESDEPDLADLPRLIFDFDRRYYGLLHAFIRRLNTFDGITA